jgi:hypothetical protein
LTTFRARAAIACCAILTSVRRINLTLGNLRSGSEMELVRYWRHYMKEAEIDPADHAAHRRGAGT